MMNVVCLLDGKDATLIYYYHERHLLSASLMLSTGWYACWMVRMLLSYYNSIMRKFDALYWLLRLLDGKDATLLL